jgi:hypothetical protein
MFNADLEKEYSPSRWTKRFASSNEVLNHHIQFITSSSDSARNEIPNQLNVKYGDAEAENYDIYGTNLSDCKGFLNISPEYNFFQCLFVCFFFFL